MGLFDRALDAYTYNERTPAGARRYAQQDADALSGVYQNVQEQLGEGTAHHPLKTAELLLASGNASAIKAGEAIRQQYHSGKTQDIKHHEYELTLDEDQAEAWAKSQLKEGRDVIGSPLKIRRKNGTVGHAVVRRSSGGGVYMQDLGVDAYTAPKVVSLGGGTQGIYTDGQGRLNYGPPNDSMARSNGYQEVPQDIQAEFQEFMRWKQSQQQGQPQTGQVPPQQGQVPPPQGGQMPPQGQQVPPQQTPGQRVPPQAMPQDPTSRQLPTPTSRVAGGMAPGVQEVTPFENFVGRTEMVEEAKATGKVTGAAQAKSRTEIGQDLKLSNSLQKSFDNIAPEIDAAIAIIDKEGWLEGGNWATGGIMEWQNAMDLLPSKFLEFLGSEQPSMEKWVGTDYKKLYDRINTIRTNIGFDKLQQMRADSPTGGALGQVSDMENQMLKDSLTSINQYMRPSDMIAALGKVRLHYDRAIKLNKVEFLMKHKYRVNEGQTTYEDFTNVQAQAIIDVFGMTPEAEQLINQIAR
jgi:hypothetical protein